MELSIIVATLEGCPPELLDDPAFIDRLMSEAIAAGNFTLLHHHVHRFSPQGVTGAAVLSESHIAVHSWPEHGMLFVDLATCSGEAATRAAFDRLCALVPHASVARRDLDYHGHEGAGAPVMRVLPPGPRLLAASR